MLKNFTNRVKENKVILLQIPTAFGIKVSHAVPFHLKIGRLGQNL